MTISGTGSESDLTISRIIKAPVPLVWKAWAEREHFEKWWIPEPIVCRVVKMDMRPGGGFETEMSEAGGDFKPHVEGCFLDIVPQQRIVFTTCLTEGWRPLEPWLALTAVITMEADGDATRYTARVMHRNDEDCRKHEEMGFHDGWGTAIDQLGKLAARLS